MGLTGLQNEMSSLRDDPRYFGVSGTGPAKVAVEAPRDDAAVALGGRRMAGYWHKENSIASTTRSASVARSCCRHLAGKRAASDAGSGGDRMARSDPKPVTLGASCLGSMLALAQ